MDAYSPFCDLLTIATCWCILVLEFCSHVRKNRSFRIFNAIVFCLMLTACASIGYRTALARWRPEITVCVYVLRVLMHAFTFAMSALFAVYIGETARVSARRQAFIWKLTVSLWTLLVLFDILGTCFGFGFTIAENGTVHLGASAFSAGYLLFMLILVVLMIRVRRSLYRRVMIGFFITAFLGLMLNLIQRLKGESSYTVSTFIFPVLAMLYFMHSNPYDAWLGAINSESLNNLTRDYQQKNKKFGFFSLYMHTIEEEGTKIPEQIRPTLRNIAENAFRGSVLFQVSRGHLILIYPKHRNPDDGERIRRAADAIACVNGKNNLDYKIVVGESPEAGSEDIDYANYIRQIHLHMPENTLHTADRSDSEAYARYDYILKELSGIYTRHDPEDPRVVVYAQPVYNIRLGRFDTAEALMRLNLEKLGLVFPDEFIPVAEANGFIHVMTEILLHKVCVAIRELTEKGFQIDRISVNVATQELRAREFCADITRIIAGEGVSFDKIAIELTESEGNQDSQAETEKLTQLKKYGIKLYLDDFGTGYSNLERIMMLPFDIIKFDRSLVLASSTDTQSDTMVRSMATLFAELKFPVLFEGIENGEDEKRVKEMSASYLQGYKFARPVPIAQLTGYLQKTA